MAVRTRPVSVALSTCVLFALAACSGAVSDNHDPAGPVGTGSSRATGADLHPEALTPEVTRQVDPTLAEPATEVSTDGEKVVAARAPQNPTVNVSYTRMAGGTDAASRYASYSAFLEGRAGVMEEADGLSSPWWGYTGYEADGDLYIPLAGVVYVGDGGAVLACEYTGYGQGSTAAATSLAKDKFELLRRSCEGAVSGG